MWAINTLLMLALFDVSAISVGSKCLVGVGIVWFDVDIVWCELCWHVWCFSCKCRQYLVDIVWCDVNIDVMLTLIWCWHCLIWCDVNIDVLALSTGKGDEERLRTENDALRKEIEKVKLSLMVAEIRNGGQCQVCIIANVSHHQEFALTNTGCGLPK